jgi:hypothetical protein
LVGPEKLVLKEVTGFCETPGYSLNEENCSFNRKIDLSLKEVMRSS